MFYIQINQILLYNILSYELDVTLNDCTTQLKFDTACCIDIFMDIFPEHDFVGMIDGNY